MKKYLSLFSGIGGFELGIGKKAECIGYSEIDKYAIQVYEKHFKHKSYGDITKINADELPDFDFLVGGFPCQAFSIAGKRRGFNDTRGTLFFDIARILKAKQPRFFVLENVKGLLSHDGGKTFETILATLQELGYYINYEIHNAKDFGVPQNRERIFIICHHIRTLTNIGQNKKIASSKKIIEEWLFQLLLNNLKEVIKLQEHASKDWVVGWLLCQEINQNLKLSEEENIKVGTMPMVGSIFPSKAEEVWQNIDTWLNNRLDGDLNEKRLYTTLTAINRIIELKTYTFSQMLMSILLATVLLRNLSKSSWNEVLSDLTLIQEGTKYERINFETKEVIITESGVAHNPKELKDKSEYFIIGHLRGFGGRQVFPLSKNDGLSTERQRQISPTITRRYYKQGQSDPYIVAEKSESSEQGISQKGSESDNTNGRGRKTHPTDTRVIPVLTPDRLVKRQNGRRFKENGEPSFTLNTQDKHGIYDGMKIRRLTPVECERLMGLPDNWTAEGTRGKISDTQRYKMCGNGIVTNVVKNVFEKLFQIYSEE